LTTFEKLRSLLNEQFNISAESISTETSIEELGLDSLEIMDLIVLLEEKFGTSIDDNQFDNIACIGDLVQLLEQEN
jgi:acyl carrier protein